MKTSNMVKCADNGIYGIYVVDDVTGKETLIYVGMTTKSFAERHEGHLSKMNNENVDQRLYNRMRQAKRAGLSVMMRPLIQLNEVYWNKQYITKNELCMMEIAMIHALKPAYNWEGVEAPYLFPYERIGENK